MEYCDYSYSEKNQLQKLTDGSYLHSKLNNIVNILFELETESNNICRNVGEISRKAENNYNYYCKLEQLVRTKIEEVNSKIRNTPKQISQQVYVHHSGGQGEWVTKYYPNPEIPILENRVQELKANESYIRSLLEKLQSISNKYGKIYEVYCKYTSKLSDAKSAIRTIEDQANRNLQEVNKCIDSATRAIQQCLSVRMDRTYGIKTYIKQIVVD